MKRFVPLLLLAVLIVSMIGMMSASAGASVKINGESKVKPGSTYKYTVSVSAYAFNFISQVSCSGVVSSATISNGGACDANAGASTNLKAQVTITVKIPNDAVIGSTGKISVRGSGEVLDSNYNSTEKFTISGSKTVTVIDPSSSSPSTNSRKTPAPSEWDMAADKISAMLSGSELSVDITGSSKMPSSAFKILKERQGKLTVNFGSYTCSIDGRKLADLPKDVKSIDLSMSMEKDESLSSALGGIDAYQLHFAHEGELPGKFTYTFKPEGCAPGDTLYLYYYYGQPGVVDGMRSVVVDADGYISIEIWHCSVYFLSGEVIDGASGVDFNAPLVAEQSLQAERAASQELQSKLDTALSEQESLKASLEEAQLMLENATIAASDAEPLDQPVTFSLETVIIISAIAALITALLAVLLYRSIIFKRKLRETTE